MSKMAPRVAAEWEAAKASGVSRYRSVIPCRHGHTGMRFTFDRKCCECNIERCKERHRRRIGPGGLSAWIEREAAWAKSRERKAEASQKYANRKLARRSAIESGALIYASGHPCPKGHMGRYTSSGGCVECAKEAVSDRLEAGYFKEYYAANSAKVCERTNRWLMANKDRARAAQKEWLNRNHDKRKAISRQYKAKRRSQEDAGITGGMLARWTREQPKECFYCGIDCGSAFHVDHFIPLAKGGAHVLTNLRIACAKCNLTKSDRMPDAWEWPDLARAA